MKKILCVLLIIAMCFTLALTGCGKVTDPPADGDGTQNEQPGDNDGNNEGDNNGDNEGDNNGGGDEGDKDPDDEEPTDRDELTRGYAMRFSVPSLSKRPDVADDFYLKAEREQDGFVIKMIGFGDFAEDEYVKLIFHTAEQNGTGWKVQPSDLNVLVNKQKAEYRTGITRFWSTAGGYSSFRTAGTRLENSPVYEKHADYFTLALKVLFTEIPEYSAEGKVTLFAMEFAENASADGLIYDAVNYMNGMLVDGVSQGDPAAQSSYYKIQLSAQEIANLEHVKGYGIEFSPNADHIYAKVQKSETNMTISFRAFTPLDETDFIRVVVHIGEPLGENAWALHRSDTSFTVYKDRAYTQTDKIGFFEGESTQFHGGEQTVHAPEFTNAGEYWDLILVIEYFELGADIDQSSQMRAFFGEYTSGALNLGAKKDGVTLGDQAYQKNWFVL